MRTEPTRLLWTGGWDSTFRVLDLTLNQGRRVQPYYLLVRNRRSIDREIATMDRIRGAIAARSPAAAELIEPTRFFEKDEIKPCPPITEAYGRLRAKCRLGPQYDWLARLAEEQGLERLELSIHVDDRAFKHLDGAVKSDGDAMVLDEQAASPDLHIFRYYRFPVLYKTKLDMDAEARASGFHDLMMMTWFCYSPDKSGRPCGICNPCSYAIDEHMGHRIQWQGHVRRYVHLTVRPFDRAYQAMRRRLQPG